MTPEQAQEQAVLDTMDTLSEQLYAELVTTVAEAMRRLGEDASNEQSYRIRCTQVAYGVHSRAQREWNRATTDAEGNWDRNRTYYCTRHQPGEHDRSCVPPANPHDPELRLLRAIYGLCALCDNDQPHEHADAEYTEAGMLPPRDEDQEA